MRNATIATKSNYFRVKDGYAFRTWLNGRGLDYVIKDIKGDGPYYAITADLRGEAGWPTYDQAARKEIDIYAELAPHLLDTDVAVLLEVNAAPGFHAVGSAVAVRSDGTTVWLKIMDIYDLAKTAFGDAAVVGGMLA